MSLVCIMINFILMLFIFVGVRNVVQRKLYDEFGIVVEDVLVDDFIVLG